MDPGSDLSGKPDPSLPGYTSHHRRIRPTPTSTTPKPPTPARGGPADVSARPCYSAGVSSRASLVRKGRPIVIATLLSRPLGFVREAVQAALFGASRLTDAFLVAYNVPEMIQTVFFSGVLSNFFVPVITRYRAAELNTVFSLALTAAFVIALTLAAGCYLAAPAILTLAAPGLSGDDHHLAVFLFRLMLPMLVLHCLLAVVKGTLNSLEHYAMPEYAGVFFNVVMIGCALSLSGSCGISSLAVGVVAGSLVQLAVQIPALARLGLRYRPSLAFHHPALREMGGLALGAFIATAVVPLNACIARALASTLAEGSISALAYAFRIFLLPVSLFAVPVYTVLLTELSAVQRSEGVIRATGRRHLQFSQTDGAEPAFKDKATAGLSLLFAVALPATAVVVGLATPLTRLLYQRGQFTPEDVTLTSQALMAYGVGIVGYGTSQVMVRLFNATKDTRTPALVGLASVGLNALGGWLLMQVWGHWGIALMISLASGLNTLVLYAIFRHRRGPLNEALLARQFATHFLLAAALGTCLFVLSRGLAATPGALLAPLPMLHLAAILLAGSGLYLTLGFIFKVEEVQLLARLLGRSTTR